MVILNFEGEKHELLTEEEQRKRSLVEQGVKGQMTNVHFSSKTDLHATPQDFFDELAKEFKFETDVCALPGNKKCERFFTPEQDGLKQAWTGVCWMNPPYGDPEYPCKPNCKKKKCVNRGHHISEYIPGIADWMKKAYDSMRENEATVVCLVPSRTDTRWWHDYAMKGQIRFIKGRLKFGQAKNSAPFPSAIVIFAP